VIRRAPSAQGGRPQGRPLFAFLHAVERAGRVAPTALLLVLPLGGGHAVAQEGPRAVYRCPTPGAVMYTDALSAQEAAVLGCQRLDAAPVTVIQPAVPSRPSPQASAPSVASAPMRAGPAASSAPAAAAGARVSAPIQRERDVQSRRILQEELARELTELQALEREFAGGQPERRGDERNYARYQQRVEALREAIARKQADVAALRRELSRLGR
jgi:hypothetical protein